MARVPGTLDVDEAAFPDKRCDTNQLTRGAFSVQREVVSLGSPEIGEEENILRPTLAGEMPVSLAGSLTTTVPAQTAVGIAAVELLASNVLRKRAIIQNTGLTTIKLAFDTADPTQTAYHISLAPGSIADDGRGGILIEEQWTGRIAAISSGIGGTVVVTELT